MQPRTMRWARPCSAARATRFGTRIWLEIALGTAGASRRTQSANQRLEFMGTELLIVGVTVSLYALCALFVRVCDRI
jgi:hypothetical protein